MFRAWKFRTTVNAMLDDIKGGKVRGIAKYVVPEQRKKVTDLLMDPMVGHYAGEIGSLKLTNYYREDNHVWAVVTAKQKDGTGFGQGRLRWLWNGKEWQLDALSSYVSLGLISDTDEDVLSIGEMIENKLHDQPPVDEESFGI